MSTLDPIAMLREQMGEKAFKRVMDRLDGKPHRHHKDCIHNLPADEQISLRGRTREWWEAMGLPEPVVIDSSQWVADQVGEPG